MNYINSSLPLVDLHRHLDGNIRVKTIWELATKYGIPLSAKTLDELYPLCQIQDKTPDLLAFLQKLDYGVSVLKTYEDCHRVAYENVQDAKNESLDYVELRFSPYYMALQHNLHPEGVVEAVIDGVQQGSKDLAVPVSIIGILSRTYGVEACQRELNALKTQASNIVALDLAGDEGNFPARDFEPHFQQVRELGWNITVHAGEAAGPQSMWDAINVLGAKRIGHGIAAINDEKLIEHLVCNDIGLEVCLTSNYHTTTVADLQQHPILQFLEKGVNVSLNTDDPGVSAITIQDEYCVAAQKVGLSTQQLEQLQKNGASQAFLADDVKQSLFRTDI